MARWESRCEGLPGSGPTMMTAMKAVRDANATAQSQTIGPVEEAQWTAMASAIQALMNTMPGAGTWRMQVQGSTGPGNARMLMLMVERGA